MLSETLISKSKLSNCPSKIGTSGHFSVLIIPDCANANKKDEAIAIANIIE